MTRICAECPHLKVSEGGKIEDGVPTQVVHGHATEHHPCHMLSAVYPEVPLEQLPCTGSVRAAKELAASGGRPVDVVRLTQVLRGKEYKP